MKQEKLNSPECVEAARRHFVEGRSQSCGLWFSALCHFFFTLLELERCACLLMCGCSSSSCIQTDESIKCQLWRCPGLQLISELLFSCLFNSESKDDDAERAWELLPSQDQQVLQPSALTIAAVTSEGIQILSGGSMCSSALQTGQGRLKGG